MIEILKRAEGDADSEIIPVTVPDKEMREYMIEHSCKAGHTTKYGEPTFGTMIMGPGIGESKLNVWPRDEQGNLIGD